jgi:hypothetical protein
LWVAILRQGVPGGGVAAGPQAQLPRYNNPQIRGLALFCLHGKLIPVPYHLLDIVDTVPGFLLEQS